MLTIVYASRASRAMSDDDLSVLLTQAREHNRAVGLTGLLLFAQDTFLQQLEGDDETVAATFARIEADDRHTDVRMLARRSIDARRFPTWSMGFEHPDADALRDRLVGYAPGGGVPLASFELVQDGEIAEALLGLYAAGPGASAVADGR